MVFPGIVPHRAECWGDLSEEEVRVLQGKFMGHRADLEEHHEVADTQPLTGFLELIAHRRWTAADDELVIRKILETLLLNNTFAN